MDNSIFNKKDELLMSLVHYFVTEEDYTPIQVHGAQNEVWLENLNAPYKIIRINSKYIHNSEQLKMDIFKLGFVVKQIKKKTFSFKMPVLNICLDLNDRVKIEDNNRIVTVNISDINELKNNSLLGDNFPKIKTDHFKRTNNLVKVLNATEDINKKTEKENSKFEDVFKPKKIIITKIIIVLCILVYIASLIIPNNLLIYYGANSRFGFLHGEVYRLITCAFLHGNIFHLLLNMYALWLIGKELETYIGKWKFLLVYILSAIMGSMFSLVFLGNSYSIGASGAIFGLMGALLYFGYYYRLYLSSTVISELVPVLIINLLLGAFIDGIDIFAHIGGLIGGYLSLMIVKLKYKSNTSDTINGIIVYSLLIAFLTYAILKLV